MIIYFKD